MFRTIVIGYDGPDRGGEAIAGFVVPEEIEELLGSVSGALVRDAGCPGRRRPAHRGRTASCAEGRRGGARMILRRRRCGRPGASLTMREIARTLRRLDHERMTAEAERFAAAMRLDLFDAGDFAR